MNEIICYNENCKNGRPILKPGLNGAVEFFYCSKECMDQVMTPRDDQPKRLPRTVEEMQDRLMEMKARAPKAEPKPEDLTLSEQMDIFK